MQFIILPCNMSKQPIIRHISLMTSVLSIQWYQRSTTCADVSDKNQFPSTRANHNPSNGIAALTAGSHGAKMSFHGCHWLPAVGAAIVRNKETPSTLWISQHFEMHNTSQLIIRHEHFQMYFSLSDYFGQCQVLSQFKLISPPVPK